VRKVSNFDVRTALFNSENKSQNIGTTSVPITFAQDILSLEIVNNDTAAKDNATIYLDINGGTALVATDLPIFAKEYYSLDRKIVAGTGISLISDFAVTDVRIIGHF